MFRTRKTHAPDKVAESINDLKVALNAMLAHQASKSPAEAEGDDFGWFIRSLKSTIATEHSFAQAMKEGTLTTFTAEIETGLTEAGAKISAAAKASIQQAVSALTSLITATTEETADDDAAEVFDALTSFVEGINTTDAARTRHPGVTETKLTPTAAQRLREITILPKGSSPLHEVATVIAEAEGGDSSKYDMVVIKAGMSKNRVNYRPEVLQRSVPLLEGRPIYMDHPAEGTGARSLVDKVGWWDNVRMAEVDGAPAIVARANIMENSGHPWFLPMVREAVEKGHPEMVGISILAGGETLMKRDGSGPYKEVVELKVYASADAVSEPGAGGRPLSLAASEGEDYDVDVLKNAKSLAEIIAKLPQLTIAEIKEARPDLFNEDGTPKIEAAPTVTPPATPIVPVAEITPAAVITPPQVPDPAMTTMMETMRLLQVQNTKTTLSNVLAESHLPKAIADKVRAKVGEQVLAENELRDIVQEFSDIINDARTASPAAGGGASWVVPYGDVKVGISIAEQLQYAADDWFGVEVPAEVKGKFQRIRSMREYYIAVTGDRDFTGQYNPEYSVVAEALPGSTHVVGGGTITLANLFGTSMNRALVQQYQAQEKWWRPIVDIVNLDNMKVQDRVRLASFGSLTQRTVDGAEYTELDWGENKEAYTPTEYGNIVTVGRRAIINDDLRGIQRLPMLLAQSAILTLNEYISALFTANAGNGPAMGDTVQVFNAGSHQGNRVTTPMNRANVIALMKVIMKMQNESSKTIGVIPRTILGPIDLWDTMYEIVQTQFVPDSANNAKNIVADEANGGLRRAITVPNWTDTNNWYLMAEPSQIPTIELGFLFGKEEPDLLSQQDPTSGMVWTNDVLSWKVRHDYGAAWIDYRGAAAAIVP